MTGQCNRYAYKLTTIASCSIKVSIQTHVIYTITVFIILIDLEDIFKSIEYHSIVIARKKDQNARKYLRSRVSISDRQRWLLGNCCYVSYHSVYLRQYQTLQTSVFVSLAISLAAHCVYTRRTYTYVSTYDHQLPPLSLALHPSKYKASFSSMDGIVY